MQGFVDKPLINTQQHDRCLDLARRDRLYLAVTLASSVPQLDMTSWLKDFWSSNDVILHYLGGSSSLRSCPLFNHPYLSWKLFSKKDEGLKDSTSRLLKEGSLSLLALGFVFLWESIIRNARYRRHRRRGNR